MSDINQFWVGWVRRPKPSLGIMDMVLTHTSQNQVNPISEHVRILYEKNADKNNFNKEALSMVFFNSKWYDHISLNNNIFCNTSYFFIVPCTEIRASFPQ